MKVVNIIALILVIIGALNWGLIGLLNIDLVKLILGGQVGATPLGPKIIYIIVGIAGVIALTFFTKVGSESK